MCGAHRRGTFARAVLLAFGVSSAGDSAFAQLTQDNLRGLERYEGAAGSPEQAALATRARTEFAGRGVDIAAFFLIHADPRPRNSAYFFVLGAVGDVETALTLIRAFVNPPRHETGILDRHFGEIAVAIEAVLGRDAVRSDPRIVDALQQAAIAAQKRPFETGLPEALEAIRLIGQCGSEEAGRALGRLANNDNPAIRTAAVRALGGLKISTGAPSTNVSVPATEPSPTDRLLRMLATDPNPTTRAQAAISLGGGEPIASVLSGLSSTLDTENDPRALDAIVQSLGRLGRPLADPARCQNMMGRVWDVAIADQMVACWYRAGRTRDDVITAATSGPAVQRAAALTLVTGRQARSARTIVSSRTSNTPALDSATRDRLLDSDVWLLSQGDISETTLERGHELLWIVSGMEMSRAVRFADRITPTGARYRASAALASTATGAYDAVRRPQALTIALIIAGIAAMAGVLLPLGRPLFLLSGAAAIWGVSILQASGVRDLPPSPLQLLTVQAIGFLTAGAVTATVALIWRPVPARWLAIAGRVVTTAIGTGVVAAIVCATTRTARLFPIDSGGWELIFDPLAAAILAAGTAACLSVVATVVSHR